MFFVVYISYGEVYINVYMKVKWSGVYQIVPVSGSTFCGVDLDSECDLVQSSWPIFSLQTINPLCPLSCLFLCPSFPGEWWHHTPPRILCKSPIMPFFHSQLPVDDLGLHFRGCFLQKDQATVSLFLLLLKYDFKSKFIICETAIILLF